MQMILIATRQTRRETGKSIPVNGSDVNVDVAFFKARINSELTKFSSPCCLLFALIIIYSRCHLMVSDQVTSRIH